MLNDTQIIGADLGRGYIKGYSSYKEAKECMFKSIVGQGRDIDFTTYNNPIYISADKEDYFCGVLAEKEGDNPTQNSKDDKTSKTAKKLLYAVLNEIAVTDTVEIMLGVPNKMFRKSTLTDIKNAYAGKNIKIKDLIKGSTKNINIKNISIYRESDAALLYAINIAKNKNELQNKVTGMVSIGFRTTEISYFDKNMKFNDSKSTTLEKGNRSVLDYVRKKIESNGLIKELNEIDSSNDYDDMKQLGYENLLENIDQSIENMWINWPEMHIFMAGGTSLKFKNIPNKFNIVDDPQMLTARGLSLVGERVFNDGQKNN